MAMWPKGHGQIEKQRGGMVQKMRLRFIVCTSRRDVIDKREVYVKWGGYDL